MAGKYQAYPEYKDSGVEWLGSVPEGWSTVRLDGITKYIRESKSPSWLAGKSVAHYSIPSIQEVGIGKVEDGGELDSNKLVVREGDLLVSKLNPRKGTICVVQEHEDPIVASTEFVALRSNMEDSNYLEYLFRSKELSGFICSQVESATRSHQRVNPATIYKLKAPLPSPGERTAIAAFLDHETARIDRLIEKQQRLIELLKEKRQAVISHAVTKGLDPNVPMKDSGVEWLGQVPEHWRVVQARHLIRLMEQGKSPECEARTVENDEWGVLKTGCVNGGIYRASEHKALPAHITPHIAYEVQSGDILMSRASGSRDLIGAVAYVDKTPPRLLLSDKVFRLILETGVHPKFFTMLMGSKTVRAQVELAINGAEGLANNITKESIKSFVVALPSHAEQRDIYEHLSQQSKTFAKLEGRLSHALMLLQERRTALISAAVTGKIDVRNWRPDTSTQIVESDLPMAAEQAAEYRV